MSRDSPQREKNTQILTFARLASFVLIIASMGNMSKKPLIANIKDDMPQSLQIFIKDLEHEVVEGDMGSDALDKDSWIQAEMAKRES